MLEIRRESALEVNKEKSKYMVLSLHQNTRINHNLPTDNKFVDSGIWERQ